MTKKILIFCLALSLCASAARAADLMQYHGQGVVVRYPSAIRGAAVSLADAYPGVKSDLETKLGWKADFVPVVILVNRSSEFRKRVENDLVTAFAVPGQDLIVMDYSKMERTPFDADATLEHELCHVLLHRYIQSPPKWLDEGVAQWASGGMADIINPGEKNILKQTTLSGRLIPLDALSISFPDEPRGFLLAYEESRSFVEYIVHEYGAGKLRAVLHRIQNGETADKAFTNTLGLNFDALQVSWGKDLHRKYSWPSYLANNIFWVLFFAAALVTLIGYFQAKKRMKNYRDEDDENYSRVGRHDDKMG